MSDQPTSLSRADRRKARHARSSTGGQAMTDHAHELRRYARKIAHPAGDVPAVMLAAAEEIERLAAMLEDAEKERDALREKSDTLHTKIAEMERQEPARLVTPTAYRWRYRGAIKWQYGELTEETVQVAKEHNHEVQSLYALPGAQQCKNCNGMGDRFDPSGEKIPCDLCESHLEEIRSLVAEAAHDIISGSDFWLSISLAAKKIYALPGAQGEEK